MNGSALEVVLTATAGAIDGKITGKDGKLLPGATAVLLDSAGTVAASAAADKFAAFRFVSLKPGDYKLLAVDDVPLGAAPDPDSIRALATHAERVTVEANGHATVELKTDIDPG